MFKKGVLIILFSLLFSQGVFANNYIEKTVDGYKFRVVKYDTKSSDYIFKVGVNPDYGATNLRDLMESNNGISAINGVFFCPESYSECGGKNFTNNERYVTGFKLGTSSSTQDRVVFAVDSENKPFLFQTNKINQLDEEKIYYGLANFPVLLQDGVSRYQDYVDLGLIDYKMKAKMQRNFICSDVTNRYIYTGYISEITLENLPEELIKLGCSNALNLDAGGSSAMIYNSRYIIGPGRDILDGVIIERKGLDTKKLIENSKNIEKLIENKLKNKTYKEKSDFLNNFTNTLNKIRTTIYDKNSSDIFDTETGKKIGYEINVKSVKNLEVVYLVNYLNKLLYELKNVYSEEYNKQVDKESLLF
ncbi:MAG: phosphodiester glycosidase family protein [Candidatus Gracilibacteria bacterium]|nr:phosphodiester glycosidase family protein [Candidatus Gracilibacteria bacterium]